MAVNTKFIKFKENFKKNKAFQKIHMDTMREKILMREKNLYLAMSPEFILFIVEKSSRFSHVKVDLFFFGKKSIDILSTFFLEINYEMTHFRETQQVLILIPIILIFCRQFQYDS